MNNTQQSPYHIPILKILPCNPSCRVDNGSLSKEGLPATAPEASSKDNAFLLPPEGSMSVTGFRGPPIFEML